LNNISKIPPSKGGQDRFKLPFVRGDADRQRGFV